MLLNILTPEETERLKNAPDSEKIKVLANCVVLLNSSIAALRDRISKHEDEIRELQKSISESDAN